MTVKTKWMITVMALLLMPAAAYTYTLLSPLRHWESDVTICVKTPGHVSITGNDADGGVTASKNAINSPNSWNGAGAGTVVNAVECANQQWQLGDGIPTIVFNEVIKGACSGNCLAATFISSYDCPNGFDGDDGHCRILDADVLTRKNKADRNGGPYYSISESGCTVGKEWNIESIMVHEVGHVLGIGHSNVTGSTMYPSISSCNSSGATIEQDDKDALNALY